MALAQESDVSSAIAALSGSGITASVTFTKPDDGSGLNIVVSARGLRPGLQYPYHIHKLPVPSNGNCTATGTHLDPDNIKQEGVPYNCNRGSREYTCELGDLSGAYGSMVVSSDDSNYDASYTDGLLSFVGKNSILGRSVVIHGPDNKRLACGNITAVKQDTGF
ncbi:hypothetical protein GGI12_003462 [Dipsacomyces acuminosporus]|nr:hypothetical protein GGI12_003462 [Dipsacomyces acuminosporus]